MKKELNEKISKIKIDITDSILAALKQMDTCGHKLLIVFDHGNFIGLLSLGDLQRAIISNVNFNSPIGDILRQNIKVSKADEPMEEIRTNMLKYRMEFMPVLNNSGELVDVYFWDKIIGTSKVKNLPSLNLPVIIMAGGKGSRLKPLTNVIPKPLLPLGEKTIIEEIMQKFDRFGCNKFYISINYKAEMIVQYLNSLENNYFIDYFQEEKPLGTAGSLYLLKNKIDTSFFISNCDIVIEQDLDEIYEYHTNNKNEMTVVAALKHYHIPYGTIDTGNNGILKSLIEKPELTFKINSGLYLLESHLLNEIPENEFFHITELIENILKRKGKIGVFPVSEGSWIDIGEKHLYRTFFDN